MPVALHWILLSGSKLRIDYKPSSSDIFVLLRQWAAGAQSYANAFLRFLYHTSSIHTQSQPVMLSATRTFNVLLRSLDQSPSLSLSLSLLRSIYLSLRVLATTTKYTFFLHSYFKSNCVSLLGWQNRIRTEFLKKSLIRFVRCWSRAA